MTTNHPIAQSLAAGVAGAVTLNLIHETTRQLTDEAPRMDVLGERALSKMIRSAGGTPPDEPTLHQLTLGGDLLANSLYYAAVGTGRGAIGRGLALGLLAGVGAVVLPPVLGLGRAPHADSRRVQAMTVAYYTLGGLAAALASRAMSRR